MADLNVTADRHKNIGGSDIPIIMGISEFKTRFELLNQKVNNIFEEPSEFMKKYINYGNIMEPLIRDYYNESTNSGFEEFSKTIPYNDTFNFRGNADGFDPLENAIIEIKTCSETSYAKRRYEYILQIQLYMYIYEADHGYLLSYFRDSDLNTNFDPKNLKIERIEYDRDLVYKIIKECDKFTVDFQAVQLGAEESDLQGDAETILFNNLLKAKNELELATAKFNELQEQSINWFETNDQKNFKTNTNVSISYSKPSESTSVKFDTKLFEKTDPENYKKYVKSIDRIESKYADFKVEKITKRKASLRITLPKEDK